MCIAIIDDAAMAERKRPRVDGWWLLSSGVGVTKFGVMMLQDG